MGNNGESQVPQQDTVARKGRKDNGEAVNNVFYKRAARCFYIWSSHIIGRLIIYNWRVGRFVSVTTDEIERQAGPLLRRLMLH